MGCDRLRLGCGGVCSGWDVVGCVQDVLRVGCGGMCTGMWWAPAGCPDKAGSCPVCQFFMGEAEQSNRLDFFPTEIRKNLFGRGLLMVP